MRGDIRKVNVTGSIQTGTAGWFEMIEINGQDVRNGGTALVPEGDQIILKVDGNLGPGWDAGDKGCFAAWTSEGVKDNDTFQGTGPDYLPGLEPKLSLGRMPARNVEIDLRLFGNTDRFEGWNWDAFPNPF